MLEIRLHAGVGHPVSLLALVGLGLFVGFVAGMFGVGGGFLLTPALVGLFGVPPAVAVGSALCQKCGTSIASFLKHRSLSHGEPRMDYAMIGGGLMGVDAGTRLLAWLDQAGTVDLGGHQGPLARLVLDVAFIALLLFIAGTMLLNHLRRGSAATARPTGVAPLARVALPPFMALPRAGMPRVSVPLLGVLGFVLGVASGLMGIGGGVLFMPILLYGFRFSVKHAAGTGILLLFCTVAVGTVEQALRGFVSIRLAFALLVGSSVGSQLGATVTHLLDERTLRSLFIALVLATVVMLALDLHGLLR